MVVKMENQSKEEKREETGKKKEEGIENKRKKKKEKKRSREKKSYNNELRMDHIRSRPNKRVLNKDLVEAHNSSKKSEREKRK